MIIKAQTRCLQQRLCARAGRSTQRYIQEDFTDILLCDSKDLWALGAAKLSEDDKRNINFSRPDKLKILSELLTTTKESQKKCIDKRWRYTRRSGETVIIRDLLDKVIKWVDLFKQVGDTVVQYDPVHAALPWAGVRFLLQVCGVRAWGKK